MTSQNNDEANYATNVTDRNMQTLERLQTELNGLLGQYAASEKVTTDNINKFRKTNEKGSNFYIHDVNYSLLKSNYEGCYHDKNNEAIGKPETEGQIFTEEMCRQRALNLGKSVYGLQDINDKGVAYCSVSNSLMSAKKFNKVGDEKLPLGSWNETAYKGGHNKDTYVENGIFHTMLKPAFSNQNMKDCEAWDDPNCTKENCAKWASNGQCQANSGYMSRMCPEECPSNPYIKSSIKHSPGNYYVNNNGRLELDESKSSGCKSSNGQFYGENSVNAIYSIDAAPDLDSLGKTYYGESDPTGKNYTFTEYPDSMVEKGTEFYKYENYDTKGNDIKSYSSKSVNECKKLCVDNDNCDGFEYHRESKECFIKNKVYPNAPRTKTTIGDLYKRLPKINNDNSCPGKVVPANTDFIKSKGTLNDDKMSSDTKCMLGKVTNENSITNDAINNNLVKKGNEILSQLTKITNSRETMAKLNPKIKKKLQEDISMYNKILEKIKKMKNNTQTETKQSSDFNTTRKMSQFKSLFWMLILLLLLIGIIRIM